MNGKDCSEEILISAYLDGELGEDDRRRIEEHLANCRRCSEFLQSTRAERDLLIESIPELVPPAYMKAQLFNKLQAEAETPAASGMWTWAGITQLLPRKSIPWAFAGASLVILAAIILSVFQMQRRVADGRLLAAIDRSRTEWVARGKAANPFNIDINGAPLRPATHNPFKAYLNER